MCGWVAFEAAVLFCMLPHQLETQLRKKGHERDPYKMKTLTFGPLNLEVVGANHGIKVAQSGSHMKNTPTMNT